jgi:hypothetical protein
VVEVLGGNGVTYYDEKSKREVAFAKTLRAVMPSVKTTVGVTPLTNAAVARLEAAGSLASATVDNIQTANIKVGAVFGLSDILLAPTPVTSTTGTTLDVAKLEDKYALVLAALAKTATGTYSAADVADNLASDLKDDRLDGLDGTGSTPAEVLLAYDPSALATQYQEAAVVYADPASLLMVQIQPLEITTDVAQIVVGSNQDDVSAAKQMFAVLRTTGLSLLNANQEGSGRKAPTLLISAPSWPRRWTAGQTAWRIERHSECVCGSTLYVAICFSYRVWQAYLPTGAAWLVKRAVSMSP